MLSKSDKLELDHKVLDVEILLISVVQGVALSVLAGSAMPILADLHFVNYLYVFSGFLLILLFWSQAIIHTLSFISWPINMLHNFLYFLLAFVEVLVFSQITNPEKWFLFLCFFFIVAAVLYFVDLKMIREQRRLFSGKKGKRIYEHILNRQLFEIKVLLPSSFIYNLISFFLIARYPTIFIAHQYHLVLAALQLVFILFALVESLNNFKVRSALLTD